MDAVQISEACASFESNNAAGEAFDLTAELPLLAPSTGLCPVGDIDYFSVDVSGTFTGSLDVVVQTPEGNLDNTMAVDVLNSSETILASEVVTDAVRTSATIIDGLYYVRVKSDHDAELEYSLSVNLVAGS